MNNYVKLYFYVNGLVRELRCVLKVRIEFGFTSTSSILSELYVVNILREVDFFRALGVRVSMFTASASNFSVNSFDTLITQNVFCVRFMRILFEIWNIWWVVFLNTPLEVFTHPIMMFRRIVIYVWGIIFILRSFSLLHRYISVLRPGAH